MWAGTSHGAQSRRRRGGRRCWRLCRVACLGSAFWCPLIGAQEVAQTSPQEAAPRSSATAGTEREVSWHTLPRNFLPQSQELQWHKHELSFWPRGGGVFHCHGVRASLSPASLGTVGGVRNGLHDWVFPVDDASALPIGCVFGCGARLFHCEIRRAKTAIGRVL